jgi:hypothetical protein
MEAVHMDLEKDPKKYPSMVDKEGVLYCGDLFFIRETKMKEDEAFVTESLQELYQYVCYN